MLSLCVCVWLTKCACALQPPGNLMVLTMHKGASWACAEPLLAKGIETEEALGWANYQLSQGHKDCVPFAGWALALALYLSLSYSTFWHGVFHSSPVESRGNSLAWCASLSRHTHARGRSVHWYCRFPLRLNIAWACVMFYTAILYVGQRSCAKHSVQTQAKFTVQKFSV
jgi:hypothetical protein